ncbi:MAG: hypothetical protein GXO30_02220 [Epsilonproteobacteria bacterium]|nr:hypothetical protein [Campylobacterota bacterium]
MRKYLNKKVLVVAVGLALSSSLYAKEVENKAVVYAETIKTLSQDIAKNYFYVAKDIQVSSAKKGLKKDIIVLDDTLKKLQESSKDPATQRVVEFMLFSVDELKSTLKDKYNAENGGMVLDYTETLLEGSESIIKHHKGKDTTVLDELEEMEFLLERASKYYIAFAAGYTDDSNLKQAKLAVEKFDKLLNKINNVNFPANIKNGPLKKLNKYWPVSKDFYLGLKQNELPTIVFISTKHMMKSLEKMIAYEKSKK